MDPIMLDLVILQIRWYGFLIALGVLVGLRWALRLAKQRDLDADKLLDMVFYLVIAGVLGARLVYVLTSPAAFFGPGGDPISALYIWQGGLSFHGAVLGVLLAVWLYARRYRLNMWAYLDVMTPAAAFGTMGGRLGNFMNGTDTGGRLTGWPIGFTWPEPGTPTFGVLGRWLFGDNLWAAFPGVCSDGAGIPLWQCAGEIVRGPVHLTQFYGFLVGPLLLLVLIWALKRSRTPGYVFAQFVLWYSLLRFVIEEPFRDNPLFWQLYLAEGVNQPGIGLFTLTQLVSIPIILIAGYLLLTMDPDKPAKKERLSARARGR